MLDVLSQIKNKKLNIKKDLIKYYNRNGSKLRTN